MPTLTVAARNKTTFIPLDKNSYVRFCLGGDMVGGDPGLALIMRYPPSGDSIALYSFAIPGADTDAIMKIAEAGLGTGEREGDLVRIKEACNMFKNQSRPPSEAVMKEITIGADKLARAYWKIREWVMNNCADKLEIIDEDLKTTIYGYP